MEKARSIAELQYVYLNQYHTALIKTQLGVTTCTVLKYEQTYKEVEYGVL